LRLWPRTLDRTQVFPQAEVMGVDKSISTQARSRRVAILLVGLIMMSAAFVAAVAAPAAQYFRYFKIVAPGANTTAPRGINNAGQIVGGDTSNGGFLLKNGVFTSINIPGTCTAPAGINSQGQIVGYFDASDCTENPQGFIYSGGAFTTINVPGALATEPNGINDSGTIVGQFFPQTGALQGFIYSSGTYTTLSFPGAASTGARGINNTGQIAGFYTDASGANHAFIYTGGTFHNLFASECQSSVAYGINSFAQIVGYCDGRAYVYSFATHAYVFFKDPDGFGSGSYGTLPFGINDSGRVAGYYAADNSGDLNGFLAVPIQ
jgi:probable HAF family extracellular repeat protein